MIETEERDRVTVVRLAHGKANAIDAEFTHAVLAELERADRDNKAVVLTGRGSIFSAGVDLVRLTGGGAEYAREFLPRLDELLRGLFLAPCPVVAAVNGHAVAGGCIMVAACDYRIMGSRGLIGASELLVGVPFPALAIEIFRYAAAPHVAQRLILTGARLTPEEAVHHGLIDEVVADDALLERAVEIGRRLAAIPRETFRITKEQLRRPTIERVALLENETAERVERVWVAPETHEGIRRYLEETVSKKPGA